MYPESNSRRRFDEQFKARVLAECQRPGTSVASVALANGLNANLVHKWRRGIVGRIDPQVPRAANSKALGHHEPATEPLQFVPVALAAAP